MTWFILPSSWKTEQRRARASVSFVFPLTLSLWVVSSWSRKNKGVLVSKNIGYSYSNFFFSLFGYDFRILKGRRKQAMVFCKYRSLLGCALVFVLALENRRTKGCSPLCLKMHRFEAMSLPGSKFEEAKLSQGVLTLMKLPNREFLKNPSLVLS